MSFSQSLLKKVIRKLVAPIPKKAPADLKYSISFCDVGSADGLPPEAHWLSPYLEVIAFEPDPRSLARTRETLANMNVSSWSLINKAVDENEGTRALNLTRKPQCSSFYEPNSDLLQFFPEAERFEIEKTIPLECTTLERNSAQIDWLKIDTQGSELAIMKGFKERLANVVLIDLEIELLEMYRGQPLLMDMLSFLNPSHGIIRMNMVNWKSLSKHTHPELLMSSQGRAVFSNTLWLNKSLLPESFTCTDKIAISKAILLLHSYQQLSLATQISNIALSKGLLSLTEVQMLLEVYDTSSPRYHIGTLLSRVSGIRKAFIKNKFNFDEE